MAEEEKPVKKMTTKRKAIISIICAFAIILIPVMSVGVVFAARNANVGSGFTTTYTAKNVEAIVSGAYKTSTTAEKSLGSLTFSKTETDASQSFQKPDVELSGPDDYLEFHYTIQNTGVNGFAVNMSLDKFGNNSFSVKYSSSFRQTSAAQPEYDCTKAGLKFLYVTPVGTEKGFLDIGVRIKVIDETILSSDLGSFSFQLDGTAKEPKFSTLSDGSTVNKLIKNTSNAVATDTSVKSVTFGTMSEPGVFMVNGKNVIDGVLPVSATNESNAVSSDGHTNIYRVPTSSGNEFDVYILADPEYFVSLNPISSSMLRGLSNATSIRGLSEIDTSRVTNMDYMFYNLSIANELDISSWDTSLVTNMSSMFRGCSMLDNLDLSGWDVSSLTNASHMFEDCQKLAYLNLIGWDTSRLQDMTAMFKNAHLEFVASSSMGVKGLENLNTSSVTSMKELFYGNGDFGIWKDENSQALEEAFEVLSRWDTHNVQDMSYMFNQCFSGTGTTLDISGWDTSNVVNMTFMFGSCQGLATVYVGSRWTTANVAKSDGMFAFCHNLKGGNGTKCNGDIIEGVENARIDDPDNDKPGYFTAKG